MIPQFKYSIKEARQNLREFALKQCRKRMPVMQKHRHLMQNDPTYFENAMLLFVVSLIIIGVIIFVGIALAFIPTIDQ
jgi:hypothetical protein